MWNLYTYVYYSNLYTYMDTVLGMLVYDLHRSNSTTQNREAVKKKTPPPTRDNIEPWSRLNETCKGTKDKIFRCKG